MSIGIDITEVDRIEKLAQQHSAFLTTVFTQDEIAYCLKKRNRYQHFAARFAAKESVMKAIGKGWLQGIAWTDIEVVTLPSGKPEIRAHASLLRAMHEQGIAGFDVSLSHCRQYAVAVVQARTTHTTEGT
ncbi:MAG: holo-ACP synthase [Desulfobacterota bacterium]|nr:holo-ACP synthase [Thermodesulfobacteriota bacterium]